MSVLVLDKRLKDYSISKELVQEVMDILESSERDTSGELSVIDVQIKMLTKQYATLLPKNIPLGAFANALYAVYTENYSKVSYLVHILCEMAKENIGRARYKVELPDEFYIAGTLKLLESVPAKFQVYDEDGQYTVQQAISGIFGKQFNFPTPARPVVPTSNPDLYLIYVEDKQRDVAVVGKDIAALVQKYTTPVKSTAAGLMLGTTLLRTYNNRLGIVDDDYVIL